MKPVAILLAILPLLPQEKLKLDERWVYVSTNLWVDKNLETLEGIFRRAEDAGYNGIMLADFKFGKLGEMDDRYFRNIEKVKKMAAAHHLRIIPELFPVGYSEGLLCHDPNLAEGLPVRDAPFVVKNGIARLVADRRELKKPDWKDDNMKEEGGGWRVTDPMGKNARAVFKLKVEPFRQYHVSVRVKTQEFRGTPEVKALVGDLSLLHSNLGAKSTQDWTEHHAVFNSLENHEVNIYFGCWDGGTGSLTWKEAVFEEVGLLNLLRRDGAPLVVKREGGGVLTEGTDFEKVADPKMGMVPWKGGFEIWHEPPTLKTSLPDGTNLRVSYYHAVTIHDGQVMICPSEPKTVELLRDQAKRMHAAWGARGYFMAHDEIRCLNWDESCAKRKLDAGAILADNVKKCVSILREVSPEGEIYVWSDMFDPHHNAHKDYYLVRGDLKGSWEGLDKNVVIVTWYLDKREESFKFFSERGHRMLIAGYYDSAPEDVRKWLDSARNTKGVRGVMYTTWQQKYGDLERFAKIVGEYR